MSEGVDPDEARRVAREIVSGRRYSPERVPKPFEGILRWLGDVLEWIGDRLSALLEPLRPAFSWMPPGSGTVLALLALALVVAWIAARVLRRRGAAPAARSRLAHSSLGTDDPDELERAAGEAEAAGDLDRALRLRFRAGLLRLDRVGAIQFRPSITSGQVSRALRSRDFDLLAVTFDSVAYGGRAAGVRDVTTARGRWPHVVETAVRV